MSLSQLSLKEEVGGGAMAVRNAWSFCDSYKTYGFPVPFCIDLAVSKCLEQKNSPSYPKIK